MPPTGAQIVEQYEARKIAFHTDRNRWDILEKIYLGLWRDLFPTEFRAGEVAKVAPFIQRTWRLFRNMVGKLPDVRNSPLNLSPKQRDKADSIEKVCFNYNRVWWMRRKTRIVSHYYVGFGAVGIGVIPDPRRQYPVLLVEDPRNCFPGAGWDSTNIAATDFPIGNLAPVRDAGGQLEDMIVHRTMTGGQLAKVFSVDIDADNFSDEFTVLHHFDEAGISTVIADRAQTVAYAEHGLGHTPWYFPTQFAPGRPSGEGFFEQSIGLNLAFMRMMDQKLALNDAVIWPWLFTKGIVDEDPVTRRLKGISADAGAENIGPPATFQVDRDMAMMRSLLELFNMENEATRGDVSGGPITGRGVVELQKATVETVQSFFDDLSFFYPMVYTDALLMDRHLYGDVDKILAGWGRGETFQEQYKPRTAIGEKFGLITVEFGPGLGGFEGHLQLLQDLGADAISIDTIMDWNPHIRSKSEESRKIFLQKARDQLREQGLTGQMAVPMEWLARMITDVEKGADPIEWITENPAEQATATPAGVPPVPPDVAAALGDAGAGVPAGGAGPGGPTLPAPELGQLLGIGGR